jgi:hypothetical protein
VRSAVRVARDLAIPHAHRWGLLSLIAALVIVQDAVGILPRMSELQHLQWGWQAALLTAAWPLVVAPWIPGLSFASMDVTSSLKPGWLKPSLVARLIAGGVPVLRAFRCRSRARLAQPSARKLRKTALGCSFVTPHTTTRRRIIGKTIDRPGPGPNKAASRKARSTTPRAELGCKIPALRWSAAPHELDGFGSGRRDP